MKIHCYVAKHQQHIIQVNTRVQQDVAGSDTKFFVLKNHSEAQTSFSHGK